TTLHGPPASPPFPTRRSSDLFPPSPQRLGLKWTRCPLHLELQRQLLIGPRSIVELDPPLHEGAHHRRVVHRRHPIACGARIPGRSEEHTSELQSRENLVCRLL